MTLVWQSRLIMPRSLSANLCVKTCQVLNDERVRLWERRKMRPEVLQRVLVGLGMLFFLVALTNSLGWTRIGGEPGTQVVMAVIAFALAAMLRRSAR